MKAKRKKLRIATGRAPGETKEEQDYRPSYSEQGILKEMMDPYWSFKFMRENGVSRYGG